MPRVSNRDAVWYIRRVRPFETHTKSMYGKYLYGGGSLYIVYSYGSHFPMAVREFMSGRWFYNTDKYSRTTSRHQSIVSQVLPDNSVPLDTDAMKRLIDAEGRPHKLMERAGDDLREIARIAPTIEALRGYA